MIGLYATTIMWQILTRAADIPTIYQVDMYLKQLFDLTDMESLDDFYLYALYLVRRLNISFVRTKKWHHIIVTC